MKTPRTWVELFDQIMTRRVSFLVTFFVVTFCTYLVLYIIDFYPEPPATTEVEAVTVADDSKISVLPATNETSAVNRFSVVEPIATEQGVETSPIPTPTGAPVEPVDNQSNIGNQDTNNESTDDSVGIRDNIPDNLTVTEIDGEPVIDLTTPEQQPAAEPATVAKSPVFPTKIEIPALDKSIAVLNPASRAIADLDSALLEGVVRHPDSADLANPGNIFILGHSSYLPNVLNRNFQAFNGLQNLKWGDEIKLYADGQVYTYRIDRVYEAKASEVVVPTTPGEARLTLATCDSFGSKDDRFIVEASLLSTT